jgi:hypothetical protein
MKQKTCVKMENLKDIEEIYRKALINKLKNSSEWIPYTDSWLSSGNYMRTFCFSEENKIYFKLSITKYDNKTIYINEDRVFGNEKLPTNVYSFKLTFFDFKIKRLIKKLIYYLKQKKELEEIEEKKKTLKTFLPKDIICGFKINKIKNNLYE